MQNVPQFNPDCPPSFQLILVVFRSSRYFNNAIQKAHSETGQISKMEFFKKIVNGGKLHHCEKSVEIRNFSWSVFY